MKTHISIEFLENNQMSCFSKEIDMSFAPYPGVILTLSVGSISFSILVEKLVWLQKEEKFIVRTRSPFVLQFLDYFKNDPSWKYS